MNTKILLLTHGRFADGIKDTIRMVYGQDDMILTCWLDETGALEYEKKLRNLLNSFKEDKVIFICDLQFGTPYNTLSKLVKENSYPFSYEIYYGLNFPLVTSLLDNLENSYDPKDILAETYDSIGILDPTKSSQNSTEDDEDF